jgi:hypothetical protein
MKTPQWLSATKDARHAALRRLTGMVSAVDRHAHTWRCATAEADRAFRVWQSAPRRQRPLAALAFFAALDHEERAALDYRRAWEALCSVTA